jgi:uncharacterized protein
MNYCIISDIHDNVWNLQKLLATEQVMKTDCMICCGDFCSPFVLNMLAKGYPNQIHAVLGNNDGDIYMLSRIAAQHAHVSLHGELFQGAIGRLSIVINHYPEIAEVFSGKSGVDLLWA